MSNGQFIDWGSSDTHLILNPKLPIEQKQTPNSAALPYLPGHLWLASSGVSADSGKNLKLYGLSKLAFLISSEAVNRNLNVYKNDVWLNVLPHFHVGGLSIYARAYLSHSKVIERGSETWSAEKFYFWVISTKATLTSLVPTQLFDLVRLNRPAPPSLRAIIIGGAHLDSDLYLRARALGYMVLPSYGMSECCSQIATASLQSLNSSEYPELEVLSHVEVKKMESGHLAIKSAALFTAQALWRGEQGGVEVLWRRGTWYVTKDLGDVRGGKSGQVLVPRGRDNCEIKISGELVNLVDLNSQLQKIVTDDSKNNCLVFSQPDARRGEEVAVVFCDSDYKKAEEWIKKFNSKVLPVAKIRAAYFVSKLPKSELGKIKVGELKTKLGL